MSRGSDNYYSILEWQGITELVDPVCKECDGERYCDYGYGEDVRTEPCEACNLGGDEPDEDRDDGF